MEILLVVAWIVVGFFVGIVVGRITSGAAKAREDYERSLAARSKTLEYYRSILKDPDAMPFIRTTSVCSTCSTVPGSRNPESKGTVTHLK